MTLFKTPEVSLTYHQAPGYLQLSYNATHLSAGFQWAYQRALEEMLRQNVDKLLLDLHRNASPTNDEARLLEPLARTFAHPRARPVLVAAVLSERQYHYQIGNYQVGTVDHAKPTQVEFNYFTSRRDATAWLADN